MLYSLHILPMIALCNDPLKCDRQITMMPRRATGSCEILSVWGLLAQITCPLDVFGPEWRTVYATQQTQQCVNVRRIWFVRYETERGGRRGGGERGVCVCLFRREYMCRGSIRWSPSSSNWRELQYNETIGLPPSSHFTPLINCGHKGRWGIFSSTEGAYVMAGSGAVTHHLFTHSTALHLCT